MIETQDIKLHTYTCDVPGCASREEMPDIPGTQYGPANWTMVGITEHEGLVLCPTHAEWRPLIRTILLALDRRAATP